MRLTLLASAAITSAAIAASQPTLPVQPRDDPLALLDPFALLTADDLHTRWSHNADDDHPPAADGSPLLSSRLAALHTFTETTYVDVKLAGFDADGEGGLVLHNEQLQRLLDLSPHAEPQHALFPPRALPVRRRLLYRASAAPRALISRVAQQLARHPASAVPLDAVDAVVRDDYRQARRTHLTLYLLNPRRTPANATAAPPPPHRYVDGASPCAVAHALGVERYLWVDLAAAPLAFGGGAALPPLHSAGSPAEAAARLAVELAALVKSTCRFVLAPPLTWMPAAAHTLLSVVVVVIADSTATESAPALDIEPLAHELRQLATPAQQVRIETVRTSFVECKLCAAAYAAAIKSAPDAGGVELLPYLDARSIREWLLRFRDELPGLRGRRASPSELVLPAFVFSLASRARLLLDQRHQAMAFSDVVLAVQTRAPASAIDEQCDGQPLSMQWDRVERPLLAALLQAAWRVSSPTTAWSESHNTSEANMLWAVGRTPFGPFSARLELSFALRDAAVRGPLHAVAAEVLWEVASLRAYFSEWGKEVDEALSAHDHLLFLRRLNVLSFKLQRARSYLSLHNFNHSAYYIRSTWHDLRAMREILHSAAQALSAELVCPQ
ncbi:hypothetical protein AB1Y20_004381 [Prymnesium parvum]|uniref:DUF7906 domain-containing protein n=1 Tax=Prymnesium parvum TaxID=97485 RepID=A0AB34J037_PRYPA